MNTPLFLLSASSATLLVIYLVYKLELKDSITTLHRWIIIFIWSLLSSITVLLSMLFGIEEPRNIISGTIGAIVFPLQIPEYILAFVLDRQLFKFLYGREALYSGDETPFFVWIFLGLSILLALMINFLISYAKRHRKYLPKILWH